MFYSTYVALYVILVIKFLLVVLIPPPQMAQFWHQITRNTITGLFNHFSALAIRFHDVLHGFRTGRGTRTASLEAKMLQQLTAVREAVLHKISMDLHKAYEALDSYMCLKILVGCGVLPRALRFLWTYWVRITMVEKAGGYYAPPFKGYRSVTQGEFLFFTIFNKVVDFVI